MISRSTMFPTSPGCSEVGDMLSSEHLLHSKPKEEYPCYWYYYSLYFITHHSLAILYAITQQQRWPRNMYHLYLRITMSSYSLWLTDLLRHGNFKKVWLQYAWHVHMNNMLLYPTTFISLCYDTRILVTTLYLRFWHAFHHIGRYRGCHRWYIVRKV